LLLEWCDRWLERCGSLVCPLSGGHRPTSLTQIDIVSFTNLTALALYNHACYNIEILIKLLTFFIQRLQTVFTTVTF